MIYKTISKITGKKPNNRGNAYLLLAVITIGAFVGLTALGYDPLGIMDGGDDGVKTTKPMRGVVQDYADQTTTTSAVVAVYQNGELKDSCTSDGTTGVWTTNVAFTSGETVDLFCYVSSGYYHSWYPGEQVPFASDPSDDYLYFDHVFCVTDQTSESDLTLTSFNAGGTAIVTESAGTDWDVDGSADNTMFVSLTIATDGNALGSAPGVSTYDPQESPIPAYDDVVVAIRFNSTSSDPDDHTMVVCQTAGWTKVSTGDYTYFITKIPAFVYSTNNNEPATLLIEVTFDFTGNTGDSSSIYIIVEDNVDFDDYVNAPAADSDAVCQDTTAYAKIG